MISSFGQIEKGEDMHGLFCFNLITEDDTYMVAATTQVERSKWMEVRILGKFCRRYFTVLSGQLLYSLGRLS
jgi:hypothetical protein